MKLQLSNQSIHKIQADHQSLEVDLGDLPTRP